MAPRRRRWRFSLNTLAIQLSAFALSFMLVALLVVGSSRAAFVEQNETVTERVPVGLADAPPAGRVPGVPFPAPQPTPEPAPILAPTPTPTPAPEPVEEPVQQIDLTDDAAGTAMFTDDQGLAPGVPEQRCIRVTLLGDTGSEPVLLYAAEVRGALAQHLDLVVEIGSSGDFEDCAGFLPEADVYRGSLADLGAGHGGYGTGLPAWQPSVPGESRSFRFTVSVRDVPEAEGLSARFGFAWETRG